LATSPITGLFKLAGDTASTDEINDINEIRPVPIAAREIAICREKWEKLK
jgi:hypothetical protein